MKSQNNKHAYLFMVCDHLEVLKRTLKLIDDERNDIYIHVDIKSNIIDELKKITSSLKFSNLYYTPRIDVRWGDFSQIKCELLLLKEASKNKSYQYYHLMSESDMPIKTQNYIHDFFDKNNGKEFIEFQKFPNNKLFETRFKTYNLFTKYAKVSNKPLQYILYFVRKLFSIFQYLIKYDRTKKFGLEIKYGSNWFSITDKLVKYVLQQEKLIISIFKHGLCVDEHFLQTIVYNSEFINDLYKEGNMRLIIWKGKANSPYVFNINDYDDIINSNKIFARKFNEKIDLQIVDKIYSNLKENI